jgi:hypothetical protein
VNAERALTRAVCRGLALDTDPLIEYAERRARILSGEYVSNPELVLLGEDRRQHVREELADARNHGIWWLQDNPDHPDQVEVRAGLRFVCLAYARFLPTEPD